ncbi:hypothetical protein SDC9_150013 [bioreactor metagenome]|uniref:Uncharacterized protein n=1 Tax=bioreactor metagenome TaxID=1076179 RepID=A0A645EMX4_9ZZZZ
MLAPDAVSVADEPEQIVAGELLAETVGKELTVTVATAVFVPPAAVPVTV